MKVKQSMLASNKLGKVSKLPKQPAGKGGKPTTSGQLATKGLSCKGK